MNREKKKSVFLFFSKIKSYLHCVKEELLWTLSRFASLEAKAEERAKGGLMHGRPPPPCGGRGNGARLPAASSREVPPPSSAAAASWPWPRPPSPSSQEEKERDEEEEEDDEKGKRLFDLFCWAQFFSAKSHILLSCIPPSVTVGRTPPPFLSFFLTFAAAIYPLAARGRGSRRCLLRSGGGGGG